jgi:2-oxoglutarate ferredoxin oxidoreductase subunit gamma
VKTTVQIRLSGAGGQGLITAGVILAEAAMLDGRNVVQTQTYGPEARLGSSRSEVIISSGVIAYPEVTVPDVLVCLSAEAARKFAQRVGPDTIVLFDSTNIPLDISSPGKIVRAPITQTAIEVGTKVVANTVALGVLNAVASLVSHDALAQAIAERVPPRFRELNQRALAAGEALAAAAAAAATTPSAAAAAANRVTQPA